MENKQDIVDTSSIIENKILTKTYWEKKMLDEQKFISNNKLLISNRGDRKPKLLSDGESESLDSSLTSNIVDSSIEQSVKLNEKQNCVTELFENDTLFIKKSIELEKLEQQISDEDELYSDCLEQFIDDNQTINKLNNNKLTELNDNQNKDNNLKIDNNQLEKEEDKLEKCLDKKEYDHQIIKQIENENENLFQNDSEEKLRVKVEGSTEKNEQMDYIENHNLIQHQTKLNDLNSNKINNNNNKIDKLNETININRAVHQEQVSNENLKENFVKPNKQGDQVSLTDSVFICFSNNGNSNDNNSTTVCSIKQNQNCLEQHLKSNKTSSNESKFKENFSTNELAINNNNSKLSPQLSQCLAKSIKSESPTIYFQQRVSEVKINFENKLSMMNQSELKLTDNNQIKEKINQLDTTKQQVINKKLNNNEQQRLIDTETKIAREILEFKEREEELRRTRLERLNKKNIQNCTNDLSSNSSSVDSTISRSDSRSNSPPTTNDQYSAISSIDSLDEGFASPNLNKNQSTDLLSPNNQITSANLNNPGEIQKILATTRIQQEIEEQTKRELALKAVGKIRTISQERTDKLMMNNLLGSNLKTGSNHSNLLNSPTLSLSSLASSLSLNSLNITNNQINNQVNNHINLINQSNEHVSPINNKQNNCSLNTSFSSTQSTNSGLSTNKSNSTSTNITTINQSSPKITPTKSTNAKIKTNLYTKNTNVLLKQRTFSTSHLNNLANSNSNSQLNLFKMNQPGRHISMSKFIATKGKSFVVDSTSNQFNNGNTDYLSHSYTDLLRPPKIDLITAHKILHNKCLQNSQFKIASELKDLYQREEELKKQRATRLTGQSQPNLSLIDNDNKKNDQENSIETVKKISNKNCTAKELIKTLANSNQLIQDYSLQGCNAKGKLNLLKKTASNPNLNEIIITENEHQLLGKSSCYARDVIMKFEEKIQKTEKVK